jgi:tetratricopeptide (TPR) repeat protein
MGQAGRDKEAPIDHLADARLSPAEAHDVIRQRLKRMGDRRGLRLADTHRLARQMRTHSYAPGEIILPRGVRADCLGLVIRGQVAVHVSHSGAARMVVVLLPGSTFGEMMLADGRPSTTTLQALTHCEIRFLRRSAFQALSNERQAERQIAALWQLVRASALLLVALIAVVVALSLPPSRQALALLPMTIGQWCSKESHDSCAWQAWQVAANLAPSDPNPHLALGTLYFGLGNIAAAEQSFEKARALAPASPEAYNNLGLIYARQGEHERAVAAFQQALELEPGVAATEHNLGLSLQALGDYDQALEHYQAALALSEPRASTLLNMAIAYYESGQLEKAEKIAQVALRSNPNLAAAYTLLGAIALESRAPEQALPALQRAIALDASYGQSYFYLGLAYKSLGQPAQAITAFERALASADDEVTRVKIRRHLGELYDAQERSKAP